MTMRQLSEDSLYLAGEVRPDCPVALIENKSDGETDTMKVIPCEHQLPQQREQVQRPNPFCHPPLPVLPLSRSVARAASSHRCWPLCSGLRFNRKQTLRLPWSSTYSRASVKALDKLLTF